LIANEYYEPLGIEKLIGLFAYVTLLLKELKLLVNLPPPNWLRAFEASARHLSFTGAAKELNVTQAAVSQKVKALEQYLGHPLFHRLPQSLKLTITGEAYLPSVREGFLRLAEGTQEVFGSSVGERVVIRAGATFAATWLGRNLPKFQVLYPDIPLRIVTTVWPADHDWENVDIDIRFGTGHWVRAQSSPISRERLFPVCAPTLIDGRPPPTNIGELDGHTVYHVASNANLWTQWLTAAADQIVPDDGNTRSVQVDTWSLAFDAARAGGGIALSFSSLWRLYENTGDLVRLFGPEIETELAYYLVTPLHQKLSAPASIFADWLRDTFAEQDKNP